ncbi:MerR family transcriptional regulator [Williamsia sterculiae]|uniref:DNA-binding transcriptional regulator, MerR family n=1 Tax=Williamsia sterculiae TaxID=1344003 RepID=A0A1N7F0N1_9NOCA|nr:MerR family transcriptional regulator [Williamsia sterculiae]SIR93834.1 DNA-binding transcriptional regulator, MerR family [Williamsia sterculiae]
MGDSSEHRAVPVVLTIGQLAAYAGVSTRTIRHYHHQGVLPDPDRNASGYRVYDATAVVRLIRVRTLAGAGVPLSRIRELLDADPDTFAAALADVDDGLRRDISALQRHRRQIAELAADADRVALPDVVADYLDRLRARGLTERVIAPERDMWIMFAARWPDAVDRVMADKTRQLDDPTIARLYELVKCLPGREDDDELLADIADLIVASHEDASARGELDRYRELTADRDLVTLMDSLAFPANPVLLRIQKLVAERGWTGWSWMERRD